jgi:hypothetical protein
VLCILLVFFSLVIHAYCEAFSNGTRSFTIQGNRFVKDGEPFTIVSGISPFF